ncbi:MULTISPECIES: hypothetical protein [unclassified Nostoc]|uniref:hypothetical protein n=1 Tax=unclassified Nostoc TaxID=2593658 RepID=UPI001688AACD|nr:MULTISPECIES: hypothetical protein [unclassified Nostoc]MBD2472071.1 hypothetical protein [Nostoc sp. FACHB-145]
MTAKSKNVWIADLQSESKGEYSTRLWNTHHSTFKPANWAGFLIIGVFAQMLCDR